MRQLTRRQWLKLSGVGGVAVLTGLAYGDWDTNSVQVVRRTLSLPGWTASGYKVAFFSDTHLTSSIAVRRCQFAVSRCLEFDPDLIVFGGDFVEASDPDGISLIKEAFGEIKNAKCPAVGVLGNHDYATHDPLRIIREAGKQGVHVLRNQRIMAGAGTVIGLDCLTFGLDRPAIIDDSETTANRIVILHEPDGVRKIPSGCSLMLSGHSHGGQVCLPGGVALHTPRGARHYISGFYPDADTPIYVTRGVGVTELPVRLFCPPEVTLLTLHPMGSDAS